MFVVPACEATQPVGIGSLESILRLLKSLKIRALKYGKGCFYPGSDQIPIQGQTDSEYVSEKQCRYNFFTQLLAPSRCSLSVSRTTHTQRRRTDLSLGTRETRQHVAVRPLAEEFPLPGRRIPHQDGHPLPDRVEGEHVQHLQLNLNKQHVANLQRGFFCHLGKTNSKLLARIFQKILLFSWETHMTQHTNCC